MDPFPPENSVINVFKDRVQKEGLADDISTVTPDANLVAVFGPCRLARAQRNHLYTAAWEALPRFQGVIATASHQLPTVTYNASEQAWEGAKGAREVVGRLLAKVATAYGGPLPEVRHMQVPY